MATRELDKKEKLGVVHFECGQSGEFGAVTDHRGGFAPLGARVLLTR